MDTNSKVNFSKEHNTNIDTGGVTILIFVHCLIMLYICTKFHENISKDF